MNNVNGMSLIELMMVVAIASIVTVMGGYVLVPPAAYTRERADMFAALTQARNMASMRAECVVAEVKGQTLNVSSYAPPGGQDCSGPLNGTPTRQAPPVNFASDVHISTFSGGGQRLVFNVTGGLTPDKLVTFTLVNGNGGQSNFKIYPAIGQIRVR